jgi:hypothetical protein
MNFPKKGGSPNTPEFVCKFDAGCREPRCVRQHPSRGPGLQQPGFKKMSKGFGNTEQRNQPPGPGFGGGFGGFGGPPRQEPPGPGNDLTKNLCRHWQKGSCNRGTSCK